MLRPTRPMPTVGAGARIHHFGGAAEPATVLAVLDDGRRLRVRGECGHTTEFVLNPASARFVATGSAQGERLELLG